MKLPAFCWNIAPTMISIRARSEAAVLQPLPQLCSILLDVGIDLRPTLLS